MNAQQVLRRFPLLSALSDEALARVVEVVILRRYAPGETIILEGDPCRAAYLIVEGEVRVYRLSSAGREQVLALLGSGQAFNMVPPFRPDGVNLASVRALTPVTVYAIPAADLVRLARELPDLSLVLLRDFASRLEHLVNLVGDLSLCTVRQRLARFLLMHAEKDETPRRWTQEEIAIHLGAVRDVVGRTLREFAGAGLVRLERQRIVLLDRAGLEAEARC